MPEETTNTMPGGDEQPQGDQQPTAETGGPAPVQHPNQQAAAAPAKRVLSNDPAMANASPAARKLAEKEGKTYASTGQNNTGLTGEPVSLPSKGLCYPQGHPASSGVILVRPITTTEEEILATERLQRQGIALDMIMQNCIVTPGIDTMDLVSGDRMMILFYLRAVSYGPVYKFEARLKGGVTQMVETNVAKLKMKHLPDGFEEPYYVKVGGSTYEMRLNRGRMEQEVIRARLRNKKKANATEIGGTTSLKNLIISIDGNADRDYIDKHVSTLVAYKAAKLRKEIADIQPGPILEEEVINEETGELEVVTIQLTESFFRADVESD